MFYAMEMSFDYLIYNYLGDFFTFLLALTLFVLEVTETSSGYFGTCFLLISLEKLFSFVSLCIIK